MPSNPTQKNSPNPSDPDTTNANDAKETQRFHVVRGIPYEVVSSFYDPKTNQVMDKIKKIKTVTLKNGGEKTVEIFNVVRSQDESLQAKFKKDPYQKVEVIK